MSLDRARTGGDQPGVRLVGHVVVVAVELARGMPLAAANSALAEFSSLTRCDHSRPCAGQRGSLMRIATRGFKHGAQGTGRGAGGALLLVGPASGKYSVGASTTFLVSHRSLCSGIRSRASPKKEVCSGLRSCARWWPQEKVEVGTIVVLDRQSAKVGDKIELPACSVDGDEVTTDADKLAKVTVTAEVLGEERGPKIVIQKFKNKTG